MSVSTRVESKGNGKRGRPKIKEKQSVEKLKRKAKNWGGGDHESNKVTERAALRPPHDISHVRNSGSQELLKL